MRVRIQQLQERIAQVFIRQGVAAEDAREIGDLFADATACGYESHGIGRVKGYVAALQTGKMKASAELQVLRETPAMTLVDAQQGIGPLMVLKALDVVARKAELVGVSVLAMRNSGDIARLAPYAEKLAQRGLIGIVMANDCGANPSVAPFGSSTPLFSTNPVAGAIPRSSAPPIVFDFATSQIAIGKVKAIARRGGQLPDDCSITLEGEPTKDPQKFLNEMAALLPLGGLFFGHKGTAFSFLIDVLAGGLSGDGMSGTHPENLDRNSFFVIAISPKAFLPQNEFEKQVAELAERVHACRPLPERDPVVLPGEQAALRRERKEIEVHDTLWAELCALG